MKTKLFVLLIGAGLICLSCGKNNKQTQITSDVIENTTTIKFEKDLLDFGKLVSGDVVTGSFKFKNTGKNNLLISSVSTSCGCTVADYPKNIIKPGEEGQISVKYNSEGSYDIKIFKEVSVLANTIPPTTTLKITAEVN